MCSSRDDFKCRVCDYTFTDERELALHEVGHLEIDVPFLTICPFCDEERRKLNDSCDHVLTHFSPSRLEQCEVLRWLSHLCKNTNNQINESGKTQVCVFASKAAVFELRHLTIRLPALLPFHKCLLCQKFYKPEVIGEHLLSHFHISSQKCKRILLWFSKFLESEEGRIIEKCYNDYFDKAKKVDSTSTLLERLPMFETRKTNICRFCKIRVSNTSDLYAHYAEWHAISRIEEWNCVICNFMAPSKEGLLNHFHSKHIFCVFCRTKFANFVECLSHMKRCWKTYCPFCKIRFVNECGIVDFQALMKHINKGKKEPMCPHCKMNFNGFKSLKYHLDDCPERTPAGVFCPCCRQKQFTNIDTFNDHILKCLPWLAPEVNLPCINGTQKRSGIPRKDNLIKFSDVERYLEPMIILEKSVNGSTSFSK